MNITETITATPKGWSFSQLTDSYKLRVLVEGTNWKTIVFFDESLVDGEDLDSVKFSFDTDSLNRFNSSEEKNKNGAGGYDFHHLAKLN